MTPGNKLVAAAISSRAYASSGKLDQAAATEIHDVAAPVFGRRNQIVAGVLFTCVVCVTALVAKRAGVGVTHPSAGPHFVYQAWSFLHGRWDIDMRPVSYGVGANDVIVLHGKDYIVVPPFPAVLLMPFVAIWGLHTSDVLFTYVVAACSVALLYLLLEQLRANGLTRRSWVEHALLALVFAFGTTELWLSMGGLMWFEAQVVGIACTLLALLLAFRRRYVASAVALGCAFFCRNTLAIGFLFLFFLAWQDAGRAHALQEFAASVRVRRPNWQLVPWRRFAGITAVGCATLVVYFVHNALVFGSPLESGYDILNAQLYPYIHGGLFNIRYVPSNIVANFFTFPHVYYQWGFDRNPTLDFMNGNIGAGGGVAISVFVTTPVFLLLFQRNQARSLLRAALWVTIALFVTLVLMYYATGWMQFGARYLMDAYPYAFVLLAVSDIRLDWRFAVLAVVGTVVCFLGSYQFWASVVHHWVYHPIHLHLYSGN